MANYTVNNYSVENILSWIKSGEIAIPEMQRPFVWDSTKVRDLIDSLYKGFPVGYIITWRNPDVKLKDGTFSNGKKVIIDGQQRITSLTAAIAGIEVINHNYKKVRIKISFDPMKEEFYVYTPVIGKDSRIIDDISEIFKPDFKIFNYVVDYATKNNVDASIVNDRITKLIGIKTNNLGVIELNHDLDIETVTKIFIRINSKGMVLSQADFAMSKISSNELYGGDDIRKMIDYFCHLIKRPMDIEYISQLDKQFTSTDKFEKIKWIATTKEYIYDPSYSDVLRVAFTSQFKRGKLSDLVNLLSGRNFETRDYEEQIAEDSYKKLYEGVIKFVNKTNFDRFVMIVKSTGIIDKKLIRSVNVLNFGYILFLTLKDKKINSDIIETVVRKWIVLSILTGRYSGSAESAIDYDIKRFDTQDPVEYLKSTELGQLSDAYWDHILSEKLNTSVSSSPFYNLYLMAQIKNHELGFLSKSISIQSLIEDRGDVHHLFPKKYLQKNGFKKSDYNQIANYAYVQQEINIKIKDDAPCKYMSVILNQIQTNEPTICGITEQSQLEKTFKENCIPDDFANLDYHSYYDFLNNRRKLMCDKIRYYYESL